MRKKIVSLAVCVALLCCTIGPVQAAAPTTTKTGQVSKVQKLTSSSIQKETSSTKEMKDMETKDFPLKKKGDVIGTLVDSKHATQKLSLVGIVANDQDKTIEFNIDYKSSSPTEKDACLCFEFYKDNGDGSVDYSTGITWNTESAMDAVVPVEVEKDIYEDQQYVYILAGVCESLTSTAYSDTTLFKIANPYYSQPGESGGVLKQGDYAVISNESVDAYSTEGSGKFRINNSKYTIDKNESMDTYKMDVIIPFDVKKNVNKIIKDDRRANTVKAYQVGDEREFWVTDVETNANYKITPKLLYSGTHSDVWVDENQITKQQAINIGTEFDQKVYKSVTENFGVESDVNNDGKVNILCYDIKDGYSGAGGYVAGYFAPSDLYNLPFSNKCEMFYIDTYPAMDTDTANKDESHCYSTLAHEFQHMVNFNQNVFIEGSTQGMDVWMDEGMAMAAEQIYTGKILDRRIDYYNSSYSIGNGHSILYWDNYGDTLANYSLSYLFLQYFKIQAGQGDAIFKELTKEPKNTYKDMEKLVQKYIDPNMTFGQFMTNFRLALLLKENTGLRGFKGISGFNQISTPLFNGNEINIRGGGAVVKDIKESGITVPNNKGEDVTYTIVGEQSNNAPVLSGIGDKTIKVGEEFDPMAGVTATDVEDGDLTDKIVVTGKVDITKADVYKLTYSVKDSDNNTATKDCKVTVKEDENKNEKPVIHGADAVTIQAKSSFDPLAGVSATDDVDGNLTDKIQVYGVVNTRFTGKYYVVYTVRDSSGLVSKVIRRVTVVRN